MLHLIMIPIPIFMVPTTWKLPLQYFTLLDDECSTAPDCHRPLDKADQFEPIDSGVGSYGV